MLFNDTAFLFLFLPAVCGLFFVVPRALRLWVLLAFSFGFYGMSGLDHLGVMMAGILVVYAASVRDFHGRSRIALTVAIVAPLAALGYYKYSGFLVANIAPFIGEGGRTQTFSLFADVLLPAGISFFTFQMVSFAIDRWRRRIVEQPSLQTFALYVSFFPQLVAGPILRWSQVEERIKGLAQYRPSYDRSLAAIEYIAIGLACKVILADGLGNQIDPLAGNPGGVGTLGGFFVVFGYSFQIYFDFYGYSLIAIGLGKLFGFDFPDNFLRPYEALNPKDFWRRWHTTLSYWIRDYLYVPLGGNKRYWRNILIVFAATGLWHGAGWNFVVWGLYHAALVLGYAATARAWGRLPGLLQRTLNFVLVSFGWLLFLFDFRGAYDLLGSLLRNDIAVAETVNLLMWGTLAAAAVVCFALNFERFISKPGVEGQGGFGRAAVIGCLLAVSVLFFDQSKTFIYFRF